MRKVPIRLLSVLFPAVLAFGAAVAVAEDDTPSGAKAALQRFREGWKPGRGYMREVGDSGWKARMSAFRELARHGAESTGVLTGALGDADADVRIFATQAVGFLGRSAADGALVRRLETALSTDSEAAVRLYAADALGMFGGLDASRLQGTAPLARTVRADPSADVRKHVKFAIERGGVPLGRDVPRAFAEFDLDRMDTARMGALAPDFELLSAFDRRHKLSDYRGKKPVVLVFIYGDT